MGISQAERLSPFPRQTCAGDKALRREVESLLASHDGRKPADFSLGGGGQGTGGEAPAPA